MEILLDQSTDYSEQCLRFKGELTIFHVEDVFKELVEQRSTLGRFILDLDEVVDIDTAGMQVLIKNQLELMQHDESVDKGVIVSKSEAVKRFLSFHHVEEFLCRDSSV